MNKNEEFLIDQKDFDSLETRENLLSLLKSRLYPVEKILNTINYEQQLIKLQAELVRLQQWVIKKNKKIAIIFEGRDAAGKGGAIRRFSQHLNPRHMRVVALAKPTPLEKGQWYFRRYIKELPNPGEIVFFDRSWYNRAVVEPAMGFCTKKEYARFMQQATEFEHMIYEDGVDLVKFWFTISKEVQEERFQSREIDKLKQWKLSPVDKLAQEKWDDFSRYKDEMLTKTHTSFSPWVIVQANDKKVARLESIRYVLSRMSYPKNEKILSLINPDPNSVYRYHRQNFRLDL